MVRLAFSILVSLVVWLSLAPSSAQAQQTQSQVPDWIAMWFTTLTVNAPPPNQDAATVCRQVNEGFIPSIYYMGANFTDIVETPNGLTLCRDSYNHTHQIDQACVVDENNNGVFDAGDVKLGMPCRPPGPSCYPTVGNPTMVPQGLKLETAVDWLSLKDSRLRIRRTYRSDGALADTYAHRNVYSHQGVWISDFDEMIIWNRHYPAGALVYYRRDGMLIPFNNAAIGQVAVPVYAANPYRLESHPGWRMTLTDSSGVKFVFAGTYTPGTWHTLDEMIWPDGYKITIRRRPDDMTRVDTITDNRGQRLKYVWTNAPAPGSTAYVVSRINIDTNFNGTTFVPDYAIDYTYVANPFSATKVLLDQVSLYNHQTAASEVIAKYEYDTTRRFGPVPPLTKTYDGRRDVGGQLVPYGAFTYALDGRRLPVVTSSSHPGGADGLNIDTSPDTAAPTNAATTNGLGHTTTYSATSTAAGPQIGQISCAAATGVLATTRSLDYTPVGSGALGYVYGRTERNGSRTLFERDARGLITKRTEDANGPAPRVTTYTWHATLRLPLTRTTSQLAESFTYTAEGLLTSRTQTDNKAGSPTFGQTRTWTYTYTTRPSGLKVLTSVNGPGLAAQGVNDVTTYVYDTEGKLTNVTDPNGLVTTITAFSTQGLPTQVNNPDGTSWLFTYDVRGRVISSRFGLTGSTPPASTYTYDVIGQLLTYTNTRGKTWTFTYDGGRRLTSATNPSGDKVSYTYDALGNITRTEYSNGAAPATFWEQTDFDALGRLLRTIGANGQTWTYSHDVEDNLATITDPASATTTNTYDALNRVTSVTDREAHVTGMEHNDSDLMTEYTDPRLLETDFIYNGFGEVITEINPDRGTISYTYDTRGLVTSKTDARGQLLSFAYDNGGRLLSIDYPGGSAGDKSFTYDTLVLPGPANTNRGKIARVADDAIVTDFAHVTTATGTEETVRRLYPGSRSYQTLESYDFEGNLLRLTYPNGDHVDYTYDDDNRVTSVSYKFAAIATPVVVADQITYRPNGPIASLRYGDGFTLTEARDTSYRLTGQVDSNGTVTLRNVTYGYDTRDNLTSASDLLVPANNETFGYTPRDSLSSASGAYGSYGFTYDGVGNRISHATPAGNETYVYPATSNRLASVTSASSPRAFGYDAAGSITSDTRGAQVYGYLYDPAGRLTSVSLNGVTQAQYRYDWRGQQATRRFPASGQAIHSVFNADGQRIAEYDETTGALIRAYVWLGDRSLAVIEGGQAYYVRTDHIGRPSFATTSAGTVVWTARYLPFGGVHVTTGAPIDLRFPGQWFQTEAGLHQNWMRDYDPTTGRYIEADPLGLVDGASVYGYARGNPGRWVDPRGEWIQPPGTGGAACNNSDRCVVIWTDNRRAQPDNKGLFILKPGQCTGEVKPWRSDVADFMYHDGTWYKCRALGTCYANQDGSVSQEGWVRPTDDKPSWDEEGTREEWNQDRYTAAAKALLERECSNCE